MSFENKFKQLLKADAILQHDFQEFMNELIHKINGNLSIQMGVLEELAEMDLSYDKKELIEISLMSLNNLTQSLRELREVHESVENTL